MSRVPAIRFEGFNDPWEQRKLGELCTFTKGRGYSKSDIRDAGTPLILYGRLYTDYQTVINEVDTFANEQEGSLLSQGGEVIVPASGETAEDIAVASSVRSSGVILGGDLNVVTPGERLDPDYVALGITHGTAHYDLAMRAQGKSVVHIHNNDIAEIRFAYPSIKEQRRISSFAIRIDRLITLHQRKYDKLRTVKKSMLDKMFPKPGELFPEIRFEGFNDPWEQRKLGELYQSCDEKNSNCEFDFDKTISVSSMTWNPKGNGAAASSLASYKILRFGDLAFEGNRTKGHPYGKLVINDIGAGIMSSRFRTLSAREVPCTSFWKQFLMVDSVFRRIYIRSTKRGTLMTELVVDNLLDSAVPLPSQSEQETIGAFFRSLDDRITLHQRKLELLKNVKKSMLDKMFV